MFRKLFGACLPYSGRKRSKDKDAVVNDLPPVESSVTVENAPGSLHSVVLQAKTEDQNGVQDCQDVESHHSFASVPGMGSMCSFLSLEEMEQEHAKASAKHPDAFSKQTLIERLTVLPNRRDLLADSLLGEVRLKRQLFLSLINDESSSFVEVNRERTVRVFRSNSASGTYKGVMDVEFKSGDAGFSKKDVFLDLLVSTIQNLPEKPTWDDKLDYAKSVAPVFDAFEDRLYMTVTYARYKPRMGTAARDFLYYVVTERYSDEFLIYTWSAPNSLCTLNEADLTRNGCSRGEITVAGFHGKRIDCTPEGVIVPDSSRFRISYVSQMMLPGKIPKWIVESVQSQAPLCLLKLFDRIVSKK